jgi:hypothetical protein
MALKAQPPLVTEQAETNSLVKAVTNVKSKLITILDRLAYAWGMAPCKYLAMPYARLLLAVAALRDHD